MAGSRLRIYWDSNVWIAWDNNEFNTRALCTDLLKEAENGNLEIVISALAYSEFAPGSKEVDSILDKYFKRSSFIFVDINRVIAKNARDLVRKYQGLSGADAVHLACAIYAKAKMLFTYDKDLLKIADSIVDIIICIPEWPYHQGRLFSDVAVTLDTNE